jgi:outer membrane protein assembly factor BamD
MAGDFAFMTSPVRARRRPLVRLVVMVVLAASLGACGSLDLFGKKDDTPPDEAADRLYNEGLFYLNAKNAPKDAVKKFEEVDRQHPYSEWARKSLVMSAFSYYQAGEYAD